MKPAAGDLTIGSDQGQVAPLLSLFAEVFGHALGEHHWRWKYGGPPGARALHRVAWGPAQGAPDVSGAPDASGPPQATTAPAQALGHVGALVLPGVWQGRPALLAHLTDVMVHPSVRGGLDAGGVYPQLMRALARDLAALDTAHTPLLAYGFPGRLPMRLGTRMGLYRPLQPVTEYRASAQGSAPPPWRCRVVEVPDAPRSAAVDRWLDRWLDRCWQRWGAQQPQPCVRRDAAYLRWRILGHPQRPYRLWRVCDWGWRCRGWIVTRTDPQPTLIDSLLPAAWQGPGPWALVMSALAAATGQPQWLTWREPAGHGLQVSAQSGLIVPGEFRGAELAGRPPSTWASAARTAIPTTARTATPTVTPTATLAPAPTPAASPPFLFQPGDTDVY